MKGLLQRILQQPFSTSASMRTFCILYKNFCICLIKDEMEKTLAAQNDALLEK